MALFRRPGRAGAEGGARDSGTDVADTGEAGDVVEPGVVDAVPVGDIPPPPDPDTDLPPSRLRGTEPLYGYVVGLELLVVSILNLVVRHGSGAPAHPQTALQAVGVVAPIAFMGLISVRNRTIVGLAAIVAAFFVTLPKAPNSLEPAHILALIFPLVYGILITQRQRRAVSRTLTGRRGAARTGTAARARQRDDQRADARRTGGRRRQPAAPAAGPRPNARYTPPKARRGR